MSLIALDVPRRTLWIFQQMLSVIVICLTSTRLYMIHYRIIQKNIRIALGGICALVNTGVTILVLSYVVPADSSVLRHYRYMILCLELLAAFDSVLVITFIGRPMTSAKGRKARNCCFVLLGAAVLFILTNDLHRQIFQYRYVNGFLEFKFSMLGILFVTLISAMDISAAVILCIRTVKNQSKVGIFWMVIFAVMAALCLLINLSIYWRDVFRSEYQVWASDRGLLVGILSMLYVDLVLMSRLVPTNRNYFPLFENAQLKLVITDEDLNVCYQSKVMEVKNHAVLRDIVDGIPEPFELGENQLVYAAAIPSGYVYYVQDVTEIRRLQRETEANVQKLQKLNTILALENNRKLTGAKNRISMELMEGLNLHTASKTYTLSIMVRQLDELRKQEGTLEQRWKLLARIVLLLVDIKRHCILFFLGVQAPFMPAHELAVYLDELAEFASYANIRCMNTNRIQGEIKVDHALCFYEFYFQVVSMASLRDNEILIEELSEEEDRIAMHILISFAAENREAFIKDVKEFTKDNGGMISYKELDDANDISMEIPLERRQHELF